MTDTYLQGLFAERIGGRNYGKSSAIYKFEKIKRAKRAALLAHPGAENKERLKREAEFLQSLQMRKLDQATLPKLLPPYAFTEAGFVWFDNALFNTAKLLYPPTNLFSKLIFFPAIDFRIENSEFWVSFRHNVL